jgi:septin family protein
MQDTPGYGDDLDVNRSIAHLTAYIEEQNHKVQHSITRVFAQIKKIKHTIVRM